MKEVKIYTIVSDQLSPPITGESFCTDMVRHSDYAELEAKYAVLAVDNDKAMESLKQADAVVKLAHDKFSALASENAGLKAFKTAVYQQMGAGCEAPEFSITEGLSNLRRFADTLHAIEREFFTKEAADEECEGETVEECPLVWGMSVEQYVAEFRKCLSEVRAKAHKEGAYFVANRMLAAWDAGFIDDTAKNGYILLVQDAKPNFDVNGNSPVIPGGWISCSERMPEQGAYISAVSKHGEYVAGKVIDDWLDLHDGTSFGLDEVYLWMMLPPLPASPQQ